MKRLFKFGLGLAVGALATAFIYQKVQEFSDQLREELVESVREHFANLPILTVWLLDEPDREGIFKGGVIIEQNGTGLQNIDFEIDAESLEITQLETRKVEMEH